MKPLIPMHTFCQRSVVRRQRGVVLYVALVVMVVMMLAGVALLRSVGTGQGVAGNLSFKQNATSAGDKGVTAALGYLHPDPLAGVPTPSSADLSVDHPDKGYFAAWSPVPPNPAFDPLTYDWDANTSAAGPVIEATANDGTGNRVRYVVHRLCNLALPVSDPTIRCVSAMSGTSLGAGGGGASFTSIAAPPPPPYFRVTTRIDGPRNTVSYAQVILQ